MSKSANEVAGEITVAWIQAIGSAASSSSAVANLKPETVAEFYKTVFETVNDPLGLYGKKS